MYDLAALTTAVGTALDAVSGLSAKSFYDYVPEGTALPYCRFNLVTDDAKGAYAHHLLDSVQLQFSVFSSSLTTTSNLVKGIANAFQGVKLSLSSGTNISCKRVSGTRCVVDPESQHPDTVIYHGLVVIEFNIQS